MVADCIPLLTDIIHAWNPIGLRDPGPEEYEPEALSIVARFKEACIDQQAPESQRIISEIIVRQAFEFWFGLVEPDPALLELAAVLLAAYLGPEQAAGPEVPSGQ